MSTLLYPAKGFDVYAGQLTTSERQTAKDDGYDFIIHYYGGSSGKDLTAQELQLNSQLGLWSGSVFECGNSPGYFTSAQGTHDANQAITQALAAGQPKGSAIYFAYDLDVPSQAWLTTNLEPYADCVDQIVSAAGFRVGAYGAGATLSYLFNKHLIDLDWVGGAMGWQGSRGYKRPDGTGAALIQGLPTDVQGLANIDPDTALRDAGLFILP